MLSKSRNNCDALRFITRIFNKNAYKSFQLIEYRFNYLQYFQIFPIIHKRFESLSILHILQYIYTKFESNRTNFLVREILKPIATRNKKKKIEKYRLMYTRYIKKK